jgi:hypothetical protein
MDIYPPPPPQFYTWYTGSSLNAHSFESDFTTDPPTNVPSYSDSKTDIRSLPGFTLGGGLTFTASDHFSIRVETDKTWYKAKIFNFGAQDYIETIKPRTENTAVGVTYKW